jgi:parallel beta helix pectate lyase-like protein
MPRKPGSGRNVPTDDVSAARRFLVAGLLAASLMTPASGPAASVAAGADERVLHVPGDQPTIEAAIAASVAGDVILVGAGTYAGGLTIPEDKPGITIRGVDRNTVVFDGGGVRTNAIEVEADEVTLENLSAHDYVGNGFYWDGVVGFAGRYLTVWNVGLYGIYAISSRGGSIEESLVSGAADAAFYIGECQPCDTVVRKVTARLSAVGYSGTNAGGSLLVEDSLFELNEVGILPNSYDVGLEPPPQRGAIFRRNTVRGSGTAATPRATPLGGFRGIGIGIIGGVGNTVEGNDVSDSSRYGIVIVPAIDREATWVPADNRITGNRVAGSGAADLALAGGSGTGNCFQGNTATRLDPAGLAGACPTEGGSDAVAAALALPPQQLLDGLPAAPPFGDMPAPAAQPSLPEERPVDLLWLAISAAVLALGAAGLGILFRRRRTSDAGGVSPSRG